MVCLAFVILIMILLEFFPYEYVFSKEIDGENVLIEGKVSRKETKVKDGQTTYCIYLEHIVPQAVSSTADISGGENFITTKLNTAEGIMCYMAEDSLVPNLHSYVQIRGKIYTFRTPDNPGEFNEALYYKIQGMDLKMYEGKLVAYSENYSNLKEKLYRFKDKMCILLDTYFSEEYRGIAKAILFAMKGDLDNETKSLYQRNGVLHILCVSGTHITILGMGIYKLFKKIRLPDWFNAGLCIGFMILYGTMIDMGISVFRAILMFSMHLVAKLLGRTYDLLTAACVGVFLILLEQPLYVYHSGFLLSFLSVIALGTTEMIPVKRNSKTKWLYKRWRDCLSTSIIWIFTLPIYAMYYYEVSLSGLILNVIILPFVSVILVLVIGVCVVGSFLSPLGILLTAVCESILWGFEKLFESFEHLGKTTFIIGKVSTYKCVFYYVALVFLFLLIEKMKKRYVVLASISLCIFFVTGMPKELEITCLSVGQGDCLVIEYKDLVCVIDGGSSSESDVGTYTLLPFLKYQGIRQVDYLFLTHSDMDHINGIEALLLQSKTGVTIERVVVTDGKRLEDYGTIGEVVKQQKISVCQMQTGDFIKNGELLLECLSPSKEILENSEKSGNETSMVLLLTCGQFSMLFTGDAENEGETLVMSELHSKKVTGITVLKVAHHGSKNSTGTEFLEVVRPKVSLISCGENNSYGHPHIETLERLREAGSEVFVTKDSGAIVIAVKNEVKIYEYIQ